MVAPTDGLMRWPKRGGFLGPQSVISVLEAVAALCGTEARDVLMRDARLNRVPEWNEPVREDRVARLHQAFRRSFPDRAAEIGRQAGRATTDYLLDHRISPRAQRLLSQAPKQVAVWLLCQAARLNAQPFAGTGVFEVLHSGAFEVRGNPLCRSVAVPSPVCDYHAAAFERMFQRLVDPRIRVTESACCGSGAKACRFDITLG